MTNPRTARSVSPQRSWAGLALALVLGLGIGGTVQAAPAADPPRAVRFAPEADYPPLCLRRPRRADPRPVGGPAAGHRTPGPGWTFKPSRRATSPTSCRASRPARWTWSRRSGPPPSAAASSAQLRQGLPPAELSPQLEALRDAFCQLRQLAEPMLAQAGSPAEPTIVADMPAPEQAAARLAELLMLLSQQDLGAADAFDALRPWLCAQGLPSAELGRLQHRIADLDFAPAHQFLTEWQASNASPRQA